MGLTACRVAAQWQRCKGAERKIKLGRWEVGRKLFRGFFWWQRGSLGDGVESRTDLQCLECVRRGMGRVD